MSVAESPSSFYRLKDQGPLYIMSLGHGATHWVHGSLAILAPYLKEELGLSYTEVGLLAAMLPVSSFIANFFSGALADVTRRTVLLHLVSLAVMGAALIAYGMTSSLAVLYLTTALIGITNNLWHPPAFAFLSARYPQNRGYALSIHSTGASLGDMVAPFAAGLVMISMTWREAAMVNALPALISAALFAVFLLPRDRPEPGMAGKAIDLVGYFRGLGAMMRNRAILGLCLMGGFRGMTQRGLLVFLPLYLADEMGVNPALAGLALSALHLGGVLVTPIAGIISDNIGRRPVVMAGLTSTTVVVIGLTLLNDTTLFIIGVSVLGFALYAVRPAMQSWMMDLSPKGMEGSATSLLFGSQSAFSMAIPPIGGLVADQFGLLAVFYVIAGAVLLANAVVILLPKGETEQPARG